MYTVTDIAPTDAEFTALIAALDAWQETLYPAESNHLLDLSQLPPQTVIALVIRSAQGEAVGCGAIVLSEEGFGEMKRVYIDPQHRGQQLGEKLLAALEAKARQRDCHTLRLETGIHQHAAITLYTRNGAANQKLLQQKLALLDHASSWVTLRDSLHVEADDAVSIIQWMMQLVLAQAERDQSSSDHPPA